MLHANPKTTVSPKGPHTKGAAASGNLQRVPTGPQDSTTQTAEHQAKLKGRSVAQILYPDMAKA